MGVNLEVVEGFLGALGRRDMRAALEWVADDFVYDNTQLPTMRGKQQFEQFLSAWLAHDAIEIRAHNVWENADGVVVERTDKHREAGDAGWSATRACAVFDVRDAKIRAWRDYYDISGFLRQSGQTLDDIFNKAAVLAGSSAQLAPPERFAVTFTSKESA
ncbi:MAG: limonene-1,2-epoxide hydrolase family protein [Methylocystis sp.]